MASNLRTRLTIDVGGQPYQFGTPFVQTFLALEQEPAQYQVTVPADSAATLWDGAPPISTYDFLALVADRNCQIEFTVNGGEADEYHFTLPLLANFPIVVPGGQAYAGQTGTEDAFTEGTLREVTKIRALNTDTANAALVSVFVAQEDS